MDPAIVDYLIIASGTFAMSTLGFAIAWLRARERAIRAEQAPGRIGAGADARFDRLEQLAEGTALDVDRLVEAERYRTKLLADR